MPHLEVVTVVIIMRHLEVVTVVGVQVVIPGVPATGTVSAVPTTLGFALYASGVVILRNPAEVMMPHLEADKAVMVPHLEVVPRLKKQHLQNQNLRLNSPGTQHFITVVGMEQGAEKKFVPLPTVSKFRF